jgi:hypothetical protein
MMQTQKTRAIQLQDLLRITPEEATQILVRLDDEAQQSPIPDRRGARRFSYQHIPRIVVHLQDGRYGLEDYFIMVPRNISETGIGLLHGQFIYPQTSCTIHHKPLQGKLTGVKGRIVYCRYVLGRVHEVGVQFDEPVDLSTILPVETLSR